MDGFVLGAWCEGSRVVNERYTRKSRRGVPEGLYASKTATRWPCSRVAWYAPTQARMRDTLSVAEVAASATGGVARPVDARVRDALQWPRYVVALQDALRDDQFSASACTCLWKALPA